MKGRLIHAFVPSLLLVTALGALAEDAPPLKEGARVRIHAGKVREIPGVIRMGSDSWNLLGPQPGIETPGEVIGNNDAAVALRIPGQEEPWYLPRPGTTLTGRLVAMGDEAWTISVEEHKKVKVPRRTIEAVDVSRGQTSRGIGALAGLAAGAGLGAFIGAITYDCQHCFGGPSSAGGAALLFGAGLGTVGAVVGVLAGGGERWERLPADRIRVSLSPHRGRGLGVSVAFAF
jgi:hypothetical protein